MNAQAIQTLPIDPQRRSRLAAMTGSASSGREIMVAEIDAAAVAIAVCYKDLSPAAKAKTVILAHALAGLRQRMVTPNAPGEPSGAKSQQPTD